MSRSKPQPSGKIPFKPRKSLFLILLLVYAVWLGVLLTMYFTTHRLPGK